MITDVEAQSVTTKRSASSTKIMPYEPFVARVCHIHHKFPSYYIKYLFLYVNNHAKRINSLIPYIFQME